MAHKPAEKPAEKKIPSPVLREDVRRELKKDGFDSSLYHSEHLRLLGKQEYHDMTYREILGTLETMRETSRSALKEIEGIRKNSKSSVSKRESSDPFFKAELNEYVSCIKNALSEIEHNIGIATGNATAENRTLDDLFECGFDIDKAMDTLDMLYEKMATERGPERRKFMRAAMINEIETAISEIERIRKDPGSLVAKHEKSDPSYKKAVSEFIAKLRAHQKELERMRDPGNLEITRL